MLQSPVSPESPDVKHGARAFPRIQNYDAGLEVAENQNREKNDRDPVVVLNSPVDTQSPIYVTHGRWPEAPQPIDSMPPQVMGDAALENRTAAAPHTQDASTAEKASTLIDSEKEQKRRWCGVGGKVLLLIIVLVVLLVAAIIGGAVGGIQARKHNSPPAEESPTRATQSSSGSTPDATSPSTSTETTSPHFRFKLITYNDYNYKGSFQTFEDPGVWKLAFPILSYTWVPARSGDTTDSDLLRCSVAFCANATYMGWRGASAKDNPGDPKGNHSANFVHITCDTMNLNPECAGIGVGGEAETEAKTVAVSGGTATETGGGDVETTTSVSAGEGSASGAMTGSSATITGAPSAKSGSGASSGTSSGAGSEESAGASGSSADSGRSGVGISSATATQAP